ncbi:MAG: putative sulfate exporter family transporter [Bacteroidales bacterium]
MIKVLFFLLLIVSLFVSPAIALFIGIAFTLIFQAPYPKFSKKVSKYLLQLSVIGLGFGMNLNDSLQSSKEGMLMTIISVTGVMLLGYFLGRWMGIDRKLTHLISSGTAICGGSAIAAISPVVRANENQTSMSLAVVFTLNAIALFIFPSIGHFLNLSQQQFGMWAAIAIHDTSSVVGAGSAYGPEALMVATTVKLTRALWIIPLALVSAFLFPREEGSKQKISIPWFILFFVIAMIINTYLPIPALLSKGICIFSHKALSATLFLIGTGLSIQAIREVGPRPVLLGLSLWILISVLSLLAIWSL